MIEINFDGLVGPTHNYAGLSPGNLASAANAGQVARPREAALQGLAKMRLALSLGLRQGLLPPHDRPHTGYLRAMGFAGDAATVLAAAAREDSLLLNQAAAASAMWTANAATVSPAPDCADGRTHLSVANLATMAHRALEPAETLRWLRLAFADPVFDVHAAVPASFGDEGAANHMRLHDGDGPGIEIFVYGEPAGGFPARQHARASEAVARLHGLDPARTLFVQQSAAAIAAGAFHNDVVAVADGLTLLCHEHAFADPARLYGDLRRLLPGVVILEVPAARVPLDRAVASYLFNSQLVSLPAGGQALILPAEGRDDAAVWAWVQEQLAGNGPIRAAHVVDLKQSMRNGGGPACLRLRVAVSEADAARIDPRFLLDEAALDRLARVVEACWPEAIAPADMASADLWRDARQARAAALDTLGLPPSP